MASTMKNTRLSSSASVVLALLGASSAALSSLGCAQDTVPPSLGTHDAKLEKPAKQAAVKGQRQTRLAAPAEPRVEVYVLLAGDAAVDRIPAGHAPSEPAVLEQVRRRLGAITLEQAPIVAAIEGAGGEITARHRRLVNAVQAIVPSSALETLGRLPGVLSIDRVPIYERANTSAVPFIGGYAAWSVGDGSLHGKGVRVGVIDTGIDYTHADFGGPGTAEAYTSNDSAIVEPDSFPTKKVLGGRDFVGDKYDAGGGSGTPKPDNDPLDCAGLQQMAISGGHGTHVAGTIAGVGVSALTGKAFTESYSASVDPRSFRVGPGVAPEASLYALKVFGCTGSTAAVASALEWASDPDDDGDFTDRLDVLNLSLGGSYGLPTAADIKQIKNLTKLGTFLAVAAGNDGNTFFVTGSPATYNEVLSVAASTDTLAYSTLHVDAPASIAGDFPASEGSFTKPLALTGPVTGTLVAASPALACSDLTNAAALAGKIALIDRGACTFVDKIARAEKAGAIAALVVDSDDNEVPFSMGGTGEDAGIPGMLVRLEDGNKIKAQLGAGVTVTFRSDAFEVNIGADQIAGFSSRGPSLDGSTLKPEISAPGVAVSSAGVASGNGARELQGTSMACPVIAGAAALVRQQFPSFAPVEVKAVLMNHTNNIGNDAGNIAPISMQGSGRVKVDQALQATATARTVSEDGQVGVTFGVQVVGENTSTTKTVQITNHGSTALTFDTAVTPTKILPGTNVAAAASTVEVPAGQTVELGLTLTVTPADLPTPAVDAFTSPQSRNGDFRHFLVEVDGHLVLTPREVAGAPFADPLRVPYYAVARAAGDRKAEAPKGCGDVFGLTIGGQTSAKQTVTSVFELGVTYEPGTAAIGTIVATGAASDSATIADADDATAYFAIALSKPWSTPAQGPLSLVGINVDVDGDEEADYITYVEPRRRTGPYGDTIVATTYFASTGGRAGQPQAINGLKRDEADSAIFHNDVVVLPVTMLSLGLDPGAAKIHYQAFTQSLTAFSQETTEWIPFDIEHPAVVPQGGLDGRPAYLDASNVSVKLDRTRLEGKLVPPSALVLHHHNVAGRRFDIVQLPVDAVEAKLTVAVGEAITREDGARAIPITVRNEGTAAVTGVKLATVAKGAQITTRTGAGAVCDAANAATPCTIATIAAGQAVTIEVETDEGAPSYTLEAEASLAGGCFDAGGEEKAAPKTFSGKGSAGASGAGGGGALGGLSGQAGPTGRVGGGFECALGGRPSGRDDGAVAGLALIALGLCARRRARSS